MLKTTTPTKGFSLIEVLVGVFVFSLIMIAITSLGRNIFYFNSVSQGGLNAEQEGRKVLRPMINEIRSASPSSLGAYPLAQVGTSTFMFYADINNDALKDRVRYFLVGTTLKKGVIKPTGNPLSYVAGNEVVTEVIHNVRNGTSTPLFSYYNSSYAGTSTPLVQPVTPSTVRLVKVEIIIDSDPNRPPAPVRVTSQVSLRNIKDNL